MSTTARRVHHTYQEYLALEEGSSVRHEFLEVLVVSHRSPRITLHRRDDGGWKAIEAGPRETVALSSIAARVAVDDLYRDGLEDARA
jgi:hypothetical protein